MMRVAENVENLWIYIQSLSLSESNRRWLAERLMDGSSNVASEPTVEYKRSKPQILEGIREGLEEVRKAKEDGLEAQSARDFYDEL